MTQKRSNAKNFTDIGSILDRVLHQYRPKADQEIYKLWTLWSNTVGSEIAANARPAAFKGRTLLLHVTNSTWLHHLRFMEKDLIDKINSALEAERIESIQLKIGPV